MDQNKLTAYRDASRVAAKLADFYKDFAGLTIGMQMLIGNDIPTLVTAVDELCAEVERLNRIVEDLKDELDSYHESHHGDDV